MRLTMLTVLIETMNDEEGLARTLASLIGGASKAWCATSSSATGVRPTRRTASPSMPAATTSPNGGVAAGISQAKGDWLLIVEPGARLVEGWSESVMAHTAKMTMPARFSRARGSRTPFLARVFSPPTALAEGLVITKRQATALSK